MADWFAKANLDISRDKKDEIVQALFATIYDSAKLVGYAHGNLQAWSRDWVELMFSQGTARYDEYMQRVNRLVPNETPPAKYPLFIQDVFENLEELGNSLSEESNKTIVRQNVLAVGKKLKALDDERLRRFGDKFFDLVDEQSVHVRISWEEFVQGAATAEEEAVGHSLGEAAESAHRAAPPVDPAQPHPSSVEARR